MGWLSTDSTVDVQECLVFPSLSNRICPSKSVIFLSNKLEFRLQNLELTIKKCGFSAEFAQVFSFGPDAFVAAPQAVETRALQPLGCHEYIMVFRMN